MLSLDEQQLRYWNVLYCIKNIGSTKSVKSR